jgi:hypothetical protein
MMRQVFSLKGSIMKALRVLICSVGVMSCFAGIARADDVPADAAAYKQKMHDCVTQMKTDHADMNYKARRKACHKQLGPMPKAMPAQTTPPAAPATP